MRSAVKSTSLSMLLAYLAGVVGTWRAGGGGGWRTEAKEKHEKGQLFPLSIPFLTQLHLPRRLLFFSL